MRRPRVPGGLPDDLSFGEPVNAAPVVIDGVHSLVWSRNAAKSD